MKSSKVFLVAVSLVGSAVQLGCGSNNGCPGGYEPVMGMCMEIGRTMPDAGAGDAAFVREDAWQDDAGALDDGGLADDAGALPTDAAIAPDSGCMLPALYADHDGDGFGDAAAPLGDCVELAEGYVLDATDCDDAHESAHPGGTEVCNGVDDDCNGTSDEGVMLSFYVDADGDGFGAGVAVSACSAPAGHSAMAGDCDDTCASCHPGGTETCNGRDDDCDAAIDDGVTTTFYLDADGDSYGRSDMPLEACAMPAGHASRGGDCDDATGAVSPGASEICDGRDNDCDGGNDEGVTSTYYLDGDGDGYGRADATTQACTAPAGYASRASDCNDGSAATHPGAPELCNEVDDDCSGAVDDGLATSVYYADCDLDGFTAHATPATTYSSCHAPTSAPTCGAGLTGAWRAAPSAQEDCADAEANAFPGQANYFPAMMRSPSAGDPWDWNCDGVIAHQYADVTSTCSGTSGCTARSGWASTVPSCGASASRVSCGYSGSFMCVGNATSTTQGCH
ncbi:MAG: putative metal-binding motif-containing protein [Sandaracinaceae bacterium]|nr:putative metal-binding motif-containing protein [Sandaracinaceae bacterium]